ncbi:hypothetical protein [Clostridium sp. UBA1056]
MQSTFTLGYYIHRCNKLRYKENYFTN